MSRAIDIALSGELISDTAPMLRIRDKTNRGEDRMASAAQPRAQVDAQSDDALIAQFAAGDQSAARELASRHTGRVLALATRMLKDSAEAEDVAQEAMMRVWRNAGDWRPGEAKLSTWLHRVALNLCYDRLRKRREAPLDDAYDPADERISVQGAMEQSQSAQILKDAIAALPDRQRAAIQMRHFEERSRCSQEDAGL